MRPLWLQMTIHFSVMVLEKLKVHDQKNARDQWMNGFIPITYVPGNALFTVTRKRTYLIYTLSLRIPRIFFRIIKNAINIQEAVFRGSKYPV